MNLAATLPDQLTKTLFHPKYGRIESIASQGHNSLPPSGRTKRRASSCCWCGRAAQFRFEDPVEMNPGERIAIPVHQEAPGLADDRGRMTVWLGLSCERTNQTD